MTPHDTQALLPFHTMGLQIKCLIQACNAAGREEHSTEVGTPEQRMCECTRHRATQLIGADVPVLQTLNAEGRKPIALLDAQGRDVSCGME